MAFGEIVAHMLIAVSITIMGAAISRAHKLIGIIEKSKAETVWKRNLILLYVLTGFFILIMITRLFSPNLEPLTGSDTYHHLLMNTAFLVASILILNMVNLDIEAFTSFFELLNEDDPVEYYDEYELAQMS